MDQKKLWTKFYQLVGGEVQLKTLHQVVNSILALIEQPGTSTKDVARLLSSDPALSTKVLTVVNSPAVGLKYQVNDLAYAITLLGHKEIRDIVLSVSIIETSGKREEAQLVRLWKHSFYVAKVGEIIASSLGRMAGETFTLGLLHDLGKIILCYSNPVGFSTALHNFKYQNGKIQHWESEKQALGMTHAEIGSLAAVHWKLPESIYRGIWCHHSPITGPLQSMEDYLAQVVHIADALCWTLKYPSVDGTNPFALRNAETCVPEDILFPLGLDYKKFKEIIATVKESLVKSETIFEWMKILTG